MENKQKLIWVDRAPMAYSGNYIGMFDLTKGLFMIEIILLHCCNDYFSILQYDGGNILTQLLLSPLTIHHYGSAPMLFMICGYGIRRQSVKNSIKNNIKLFIFPYLCVILGVEICVVLRWLFEGGDLRSQLLRWAASFLLGYHPGDYIRMVPLEQIGPAWFFFTYTFGSVYLNLVLQEKETWVQMLILTAGSGLALILIGIPLPFCLHQIAICAGFMYVGMRLKGAKALRQKLPLSALIPVYLLCAISTKLGGLAEISNSVYLLGALDLVTAYIAGIVLLWLHMRLNVLQGLLADGLRWVGRHMMWLCCIHTVSCLMGPWDALAAYFADTPAVGLFLEIVISFAFAFGICLLLETGRKKLRRAGKSNRI